MRSIVDYIYKYQHNYSSQPKSSFDREQLEREIAATNAQIGRLVYDLYGINEPTRCAGVLRNKRSGL